MRTYRVRVTWKEEREAFRVVDAETLLEAIDKATDRRWAEPDVTECVRHGRVTADLDETQDVTDD